MRSKSHFLRFELGENTRMALKTLRENKLRSLLTVIGVVMGVTTLLSVSAIMVGLDQDMRAWLQNFGPDTLFIYKFTPGINIGRLSAEERSRKPLTYDDGMAIMEQAPAVKTLTIGIVPPRGRIHPARYQSYQVTGVNHNGTSRLFQYP